MGEWAGMGMDTREIGICMVDIWLGWNVLGRENEMERGGARGVFELCGCNTYKNKSAVSYELWIRCLRFSKEK